LGRSILRSVQDQIQGLETIVLRASRSKQWSSSARKSCRPCSVVAIFTGKLESLGRDRYGYLTVRARTGTPGSGRRIRL